MLRERQVESNTRFSDERQSILKVNDLRSSAQQITNKYPESKHFSSNDYLNDSQVTSFDQKRQSKETFQLGSGNQAYLEYTTKMRVIHQYNDMKPRPKTSKIRGFATNFQTSTTNLNNESGNIDQVLSKEIS